MLLAIMTCDDKYFGVINADDLNPSLPNFNKAWIEVGTINEADCKGTAEIVAAIKRDGFYLVSALKSAKETFGDQLNGLPG